MKVNRSLIAVFAVAWLAAGPSLAQTDGSEQRPTDPEPGGGRPAHGHARSLRHDLMQSAAPPADMPAPHMRMSPEERRQLRRDIHEANREFVHRERRRHGW